MDSADGQDPAAEFAELMGKAAISADAETAEAPYGYTTDPATGQRRPKKTAGRPRKSPSLDQLKAPESKPDAVGEGDAGGGAPASGPPPADRAPDDKRKLSRSRARAVSPDTVPPYRAGVITTGINRLYRRTGKIVRAMDSDIGEAIIQSARNTADPGEPNDSVGAAWEELCKTNPRIRKFVMKFIAGGAWAQLAAAHAPIVMAIVMKPAILRWIPFSRLIESMAEPDEDTPEGEGGLPGGMTAADAAQIAQLAEQQIARMGLKVPPEVAEQMRQAAGGLVNGKVPVPADSMRSQPRRPPARAQRKRGG